MFPPVRRPALHRETLRRCPDRPRLLQTERASTAAVNRRYGGSTNLEASMAPRDWSSPATPAAGRRNDPAALLFHVKRESASARRLCRPLAQSKLEPDAIVGP